MQAKKSFFKRFKWLTIVLGSLVLATSGFFILNYTLKDNELPIVVIIPSYNNVKWYEKNLSSLEQQGKNYKNWRAIYINDCSKDETGQAVEKYIKDHNLGDKITLINNPENKGALYNLYTAIHSCKDNEIILNCDGDDWFPPYADVFNTINNVYKNGDVWLTYGQFTSYPSGQIGHCRQIPDFIVAQNAFRYYTWLSSHLRTYYAGLAKKVKVQDLMKDGKFYSMNADLALMFPMLEMAGKHSKFLNKILYVYNRDNPISDWRKNIDLVLSLEREIRSKPRYLALASLDL